MDKAKLRVFIADDEKLICNVLTRVIDFEELGLELIGVVNDGESLLSAIREQRPHIVLTDIFMPKMDGLEVVRHIRQEGIECAFIIISGYRQFEYAYNALKYDVSDFILKPIDAAEINNALKKVAADIRQKSQSELPGNADALRRYFMTAVLDKAVAGSLSIEEANRDYLTTFREGLFREVIIKLDFDNDLKLLGQNMSALYDKIEELTVQILGKHCYDWLFERKFDGLHVLINYPSEINQQMPTEFKALHVAAKEAFSLFGGMCAVVCSSLAKKNLSELAQAYEEVCTAAWTRRFIYSYGMIIYDESLIRISEGDQAKLDSIFSQIRSAIETLNKGAFCACLDEFFAMPVEALTTESARLFALDLVNTFFDIQREHISEFADPGDLKNELLYVVHRATTAAKYKDTLKQQYGQLIDRISESVDRQNKRPIRLAQQYIEENYSKKIDLNVIAEIVELSPVYFSHVFKKETGENFTDYLNAYRIKIAKQLLKDTNLSVKEISWRVGFTDPQYFSKLFKKTVGLKPIEYRKFYG